MNLAEIIPLADSSGPRGGWWIVMCVGMLVMMGMMMFGMPRMRRGSERSASQPSDRFAARESPVETLERRFAEGELSIEEYEARREALVNGMADDTGDRDRELVTASRSEEGRQ